MDLPGRGKWPPMLWIGGGQGAGKTTLSCQLSRASDLPLHRVDMWTYDHHARMPAGDSLDEQLARGPEAAADAFESHSRLRLELVLDDRACAARPGRPRPDDYAARITSELRLIAQTLSPPSTRADSAQPS